MLLILSNQNSFSSTIRIFNMQKTSRINSDKSSLADKQKERKHTTPNRRNNTGTSRAASDTPRNTSTIRTAHRPSAQHLGHRHSTSTTDTAPRPPTQRIVHQHSASTIRATHRPPAASRPPAQHLDHRHSASSTAQNLDCTRSTSATPSRPIEQIFALFLSARGQNSATTHCFT